MNFERISMIIKYLDYHLLSDWETDFFISVRDQFKRKGFLTGQQKNKLEEIWKKNQQ